MPAERQTCHARLTADRSATEGSRGQVIAVTFQVSWVTWTLGVGGSLEPGDMLTVPDDWSMEQAAEETSKKQSGSEPRALCLRDSSSAVRLPAS